MESLDDLFSDNIQDLNDDEQESDVYLRRVLIAIQNLANSSNQLPSPKGINT